MSDFTLKRGDTLPKWRVTLKNGDGSVQDVSGATILFRMKSTLDENVKFQHNADIIDAVNGIVEYAWQPSDTAVSGAFLAEFVAMYGSSPMTFPNASHLKVKIIDNLT